MTTLHELTAHLDPIDRAAVLYAAKTVNDDAYQTWVLAGITLYTLTEGSEFGLRLFSGWSGQSHKNLARKNEEFWNNSWWRASHLLNLVSFPLRRPLDNFDHTTATTH
jgi:hypothetical protein